MVVVFWMWLKSTFPAEFELRIFYRGCFAFRSSVDIDQLALLVRTRMSSWVSLAFEVLYIAEIRISMVSVFIVIDVH